ncbi:MAG: efflux RND transporter periplasmic adaptor subunit, partial [Rhodospirillaceae bacterium]|nr:efflux RND transporter periplasmic adaptor subunit [Rhodospirillaceae bacterium]
RTVIRAPFDAIVDERDVELGAYVKDGSPIALLVDEDPYLVVAQVSENDIGRLKRNGKGRATLVTGHEVEGRIYYIAASADEATRTYRVELLVPNPGGKLRHGTTAELKFPTELIQAHFITPAVLTLNDSGAVGVRCVETGGKVAFYPVDIVDSTADGIWIAGLPEQTELIMVGQEFVRQGDRVRVIGGEREDPAPAKVRGAPAS